ncbi:hypothetical protein SAMN04488074_105138 [Lentzea albidocapillata subsp. violacea]|uniref:Uncharacterized protein n=1 Tax=Lentzea albidocapillata subsp. violacea TaxID=128104 RepID=A0A1G9AY79_9PSEU|nr:hypothetical protein [Lentzea albidocapillata]SDK31585.1 hypothetical protein SAMN04488074_105138 [Lentzea albidocapillata subsp. violacea]
MPTTMISPDPQPDDNRPSRWFTTGQLPDVEPARPDVQLPFEPCLLVASPSAVPLPKRPGGKHRNGTPVHQLMQASLTKPTAADLATLSAVVDELNGALSHAAAEPVSDELTRKSAERGDAVRPEFAAAAARRIAKGHLSYSERESIAGVFSAYAKLPTSAALPVALLAVLESAVAVLSVSRVDQQLAIETDGPTTSTGTDGAL